MNFTQGSNLPAVTLIMIIAISIIINVNIFIIVDIVVVIVIILHNWDLAVSEPKRAESLYYNTSTIAIIAVAIVIIVIVPMFIIIDQVPSKTDLAMAALAFSGLLPVLIAGIVIIVFIGMFR